MSAGSLTLGNAQQRTREDCAEDERTEDEAQIGLPATDTGGKRRIKAQKEKKEIRKWESIRADAAW